MSECGVCIDGDYGFDGITEFHEVKQQRARRLHRCEECNGVINPGDEYEYTVMKCGDFSTVKTCLSCAEIRDVFVCGQFCYGMLWDEMEEQVFPELTTATECLHKLSAPNRTRVILKWQQWKGLR